MAQENQMITPAFHFAAHTFGWAKSLVTAFISWASGCLAGTVALQIAPETVVRWYEHPAVISAVVTSGLLLLMKFIDVRRDKQKEAERRESDGDERSVTLTGKIQELTQQERKELLGGLNALHEKEVEFWKDQLTLKSISEFESRTRGHRFGNEVTRLHNHIHQCHRIIANEAASPIPEFQLRYHDELMEGISRETEQFRQSLAERHTQAMRDEEK